MNWSGGNIYGSLLVTSNVLLNISGSDLKQLLGPLTNSGNVVWTGSGQVQVAYSVPDFYGVIYNQAGALFDLQSDALLNGYTGNEVFNNAGTLRKSAGSGTTFSLQLNNTGIVQVQSGTMELANGGGLGGQFTASAGTMLLLSGGNFVESGTPIISGAGVSQFVGGNLTLVSDAIPGLALNGGILILDPAFQGGGITNLTLTGSTLSGTNSVRGMLNWGAGALYGALTVASNGVLNITGSSLKQLFCPLTNAGNVVWTGSGQVQVAYAIPTYDGVIYNQAGALFDIQSDTVLNDDTGNEVFNNAGTLRKSGGSGTSTFNLRLNNAGTVEVQSGTMALYNGGNLGGQFTVSAGATLLLSGGNFSQSGAPIFSGAGLSQFVGGNLTLNSDVVGGLALNGGTLILNPGFQGGSITNLTLTGTALSGTNTVRGMLNWGAGVLYGALTVASNGVLNITGSSLKQLFGPLTNAGNVVWIGSGQVQVAYSVPNFYGVIYNQAGGLFDLQSDALLNSYVGNEVFNNAGTLRKSSGTGTSTIYVGLNNSGTLETDMGIVSLSRAYAGTGNPNLSFSLGGPAAGTGYGQIAFAGQLVLSGSLTATTRNAYRPNPGDSFHVLTYASLTGAPGCLGLDLGGGVLLQPQFGATAMNLVVTTYPTNAAFPTLSIAFAPGGLLLTWPLGFPGWTLQGTTNLSSHVWTPIPTPCGNQALVPAAVPRQYFRLVSSN
jgi:hypothetical protein